MKAKKILRDRLADVGDAIIDVVEDVVNDMFAPYLDRLAETDRRLAEIEGQTKHTSAAVDRKKPKK